MRPSYLAASAALLLALCPPCVAQETDKQMESRLSDQFKGRVLTLRVPSRGPLVRYDAQGKLLEPRENVS